MGPPLLIGAGLGAATSLAMGKNPFMGALLGGATGGAFGGAGGFGSGFGLGEGGFLSGLQGVAPEAASLGTGGYAALGQNALGPIGGAATGGINFGANGINSTLGGTNLSLGGQGIQLDKFNPAFNFTDEGLSFADKGLSSADQMFANKFVTEQNPFALDPRRMAVDTPLTFGERLSNLGSSAFSYGKENPMSVLGGANTLSNMSSNAAAQSQQRLNDAIAKGQLPIKQGDSTMIQNYNTPSVNAAGADYGISPESIAAGKVAQLSNKAFARIPETDKRKIGNFYTSLIGQA